MGPSIRPAKYLNLKKSFVGQFHVLNYSYIDNRVEDRIVINTNLGADKSSHKTGSNPVEFGFRKLLLYPILLTEWSFVNLKYPLVYYQSGKLL